MDNALKLPKNTHVRGIISILLYKKVFSFDRSTVDSRTQHFMVIDQEKQTLNENYNYLYLKPSITTRLLLCKHGFLSSVWDF